MGQYDYAAEPLKDKVTWHKQDMTYGIMMSGKKPIGAESNLSLKTFKTLIPK